MGTATLNVRLPEELKERGLQVLEREGVSVSDLVRDLFGYLEENQELPDFAVDSKRMKKADVERRRAAMESLVGILPSDIDLDKARTERLMRKVRSGVRV